MSMPFISTIIEQFKDIIQTVPKFIKLSVIKILNPKFLLTIYSKALAQLSNALDWFITSYPIKSGVLYALLIDYVIEGKIYLEEKRKAAEKKIKEQEEEDKKREKNGEKPSTGDPETDKKIAEEQKIVDYRNKEKERILNDETLDKIEKEKEAINKEIAELKEKANKEIEKAKKEESEIAKKLRAMRDSLAIKLKVILKLAEDLLASINQYIMIIKEALQKLAEGKDAILKFIEEISPLGWIKKIDPIIIGIDKAKEWINVIKNLPDAIDKCVGIVEEKLMNAPDLIKNDVIKMMDLADQKYRKKKELAKKKEEDRKKQIEANEQKMIDSAKKEIESPMGEEASDQDEDHSTITEEDYKKIEQEIAKIGEEQKKAEEKLEQDKTETKENAKETNTLAEKATKILNFGGGVIRTTFETMTNIVKRFKEIIKKFPYGIFKDMGVWTFEQMVKLQETVDSYIAAVEEWIKKIEEFAKLIDSIPSSFFPLLSTRSIKSFH